MTTRNRPVLPADLRRPSLLGTAGVITHALALFLVPAALARLSFAWSMPIPVRALVLLPLFFLAGQGLQMLAFVGHEGFHFSLHKNRKVSAMLGMIFASIVPGHMPIGVAISHWNHHRFTNDVNDPDTSVFRRYRTLLGRLFLARPTIELQYLRNGVSLAIGRPLPFEYQFPLDATTVQRFAWFNIGLSLVVHTFYITLAVVDPLTPLVTVALPFLATIFISGIRPYIEHAGTELGDSRNSRTRKSPILTALYFGSNYHLEHHMYPTIPCYRLPEVHRLLTEQGVLEGAPVETTLFGAFRYATSEAQYPVPAQNPAN